MSKKVDMRKCIEIFRRSGLNQVADNIERIGRGEQPLYQEAAPNCPVRDKTWFESRPSYSSEPPVQKRNWARERADRLRSTSESELDTLKSKCGNYEREISRLNAELEREKGFARHLIEKDLEKRPFSRGGYSDPFEPGHYKPLFSEPPSEPKIIPSEQMLDCLYNPNVTNALSLRHRGEDQEGRCLIKATGRYLQRDGYFYCHISCPFRGGDWVRF
jgi:hypothetical protein